MKELIGTKGPLTGEPDETLYPIRTEGEVLRSKHLTGIFEEILGNVLIPILKNDPAGKERTYNAVPDGNRTSIIVDMTVERDGFTFFPSIKGTGARRGMYDDGPLDRSVKGMEGGGMFSSESWFGENPWGAMSRQACIEDLAITDLALRSSIEGFHICPMVMANPLPEMIMKKASDHFWYRRLERKGPFYQEVRLVPSDVRLFYQSGSTLGRSTTLVLSRFGVESLEDLEGFILNYTTSGMAALTLLARTLKRSNEGTLEGLDYNDVWLDKDSVLAPDGTLFFADIEGLEDLKMHSPEEVEKGVRRQFNRNFYEFMYGLDRLIRELSILKGRDLHMERRRHYAAGFLEASASGDPHMVPEWEGSRLFMSLRTGRKTGEEDIRIKVLDLE